MLRSAPLMTWGFVFALCLPAFGQDDALNELYGNGVHAYNGGDYREAYQQLTQAIENNSGDPRVYYYRGLSYLKLGRPQEADADFATAARLEMSDIDRFYNVSKALERVQGRARVQIERHRSSARLAAYHERERARYERYERIRRNEPNVLLQPKGDKAADDAPEAEMAEGEAESEGPPAPEEEMTEEKEKPASADDKDPFAEKEMPADEESKKKPSDEEKDPFAEESEAPEKEMAAGEKAAPADATAKKIPAGKLFKGLASSVTRGALKTAAGAGEQPAAGDAAAEPAAPPQDKKPADDDPFAN